MLDVYLAFLYDVETRIPVRAVKRNIDRFPKDFMFQLDDQEVTGLKTKAEQVDVTILMRSRSRE